MPHSLGDAVGAGLERSCDPDEWVDAVADQAHFTRTFKAAFGMTPGRYARLSAARR